ncbi:MAG: PD40 domain-containing protein [Xanthomonadales bacterium]|nr:PD40 domain-containing protein [Xanthomonadales bacterium]
MPNVHPLILLLAGSHALAADSAAIPPDPFAPLQPLIGHCWRAPMGEQMHDIQCFDWMLDGKFVRSTHVVLNPGPVYSGETIYRFDPDAKRLGFHYFTSTGALSQGQLEATTQGYLVPESHVGADGVRTELRSRFEHLDATHFSVRTEVLKGEAWGIHGERTYTRADVDAALRAAVVVRHGEHDYVLAYTRSTDAGWRVVRRDARGEAVLAGDIAADSWAWSARDAQLLLLSQANAEDGAKGWRPHRLGSDGRGFARVHADRVADGFLDRSPDGRTWAAERREGTHKRIVFFAEGDTALRYFGAQNADYDDADPQFSPDGERLLFRSNRSGSWEIHTAAPDGSDLVQLTRDDANNAIDPHEYGGEGPPRWSPDGRRVLWMRKFPGRGYDLWMMDADGRNAKALTDNGKIDDAYPSWSPDGQRIAFDSNRDGNNEIYLMDADGSNVLRVTWTPQAELAPLWVRSR